MAALCGELCCLRAHLEVPRIIVRDTTIHLNCRFTFTVPRLLKSSDSNTVMEKRGIHTNTKSALTDKQTFGIGNNPNTQYSRHSSQPQSNTEEGGRYLNLCAYFSVL